MGNGFFVVEVTLGCGKGDIWEGKGREEKGGKGRFAPHILFSECCMLLFKRDAKLDMKLV